MLFKNTQLFVRNLHRWDDLYVLFVRSSSVVCIERRFLEVWFETMDVNAEKKSGFFCFRSYPLLEAAREKDWSMICLLLYFGADPSCRDSRGRTVFDYVKSEALKQKVHSLHAKSRTRAKETSLTGS